LIVLLSKLIYKTLYYSLQHNIYKCSRKKNIYKCYTLVLDLLWRWGLGWMGTMGPRLEAMHAISLRNCLSLVVLERKIKELKKNKK
jgi:hypothetical protein